MKDDLFSLETNPVTCLTIRLSILQKHYNTTDSFGFLNNDEERELISSMYIFKLYR